MNEAAAPALVTARTLAAGAAGGVLFAVLNLPVPWLSGPLAAVAALAMAGFAVHLPRWLCDTGLFIAGISLGSTVTPEALAAVSRYPLSILGLALSVGGVVYVSMTVLEKLFGWDRQTAYLSSVPGALTLTMALAAETGANASRVAVVQSIRLFVLVALLPMFIAGAAASATLPGQSVMTAGAMALVFAAGLAAEFALARIGAVTPLFLGGMIAATVLHLTEWAPGALPDPIVMVGFLLIGIWCGVRFEGTTLRKLLAVVAPGLASLTAVLGVSAVAALAVHAATGIALAEVLVALSPGGVEAMILVGASLGLDTLYIGTHHIVRLLLLNAFTPLFVPPGKSPRAA